MVMKFLDFHFPPMQPNISSELKNQHDVIEDSVCYAAFRARVSVTDLARTSKQEVELAD
ncbi:hypothetical protein AAG906_005225 [Vitis piasezkii]